MVRPKASEANLGAAIAFSFVIAKHVPEGQNLGPTEFPVFWKGRRSIHSLFAVFLPDLSRELHEKSPRNRAAVSVLELNKALQARGFHTTRKQEFTRFIVYKRKFQLYSQSW
jgi:hypothetical protein